MKRKDKNIPSKKEIEKEMKKTKRKKPGKPSFPEGKGRSSPLYENTDKPVTSIN